MLKFKNMASLVIILVLSMITFAGCANIGVKEDPEAQKYLGTVLDYCSRNNLNVDRYMGKTLIRGKDYKPVAEAQEPVVYEWRVYNRDSKEKFIIWVGPIMPMLPNVKPGVTLARERYAIGEKAVEIKEEPEDKK